MILFRQLSIRDKLTLALGGATVLAFAVVSAMLVLFGSLALEGRARQIMAPYAQLISVGAGAAVDFEDPVRAEEILATLGANPQFLEAEIVLRDGRSLARYPGTNATSHSHPARPDGLYLVRNRAELIQSLSEESRLHLVMSLEEFNRQTRNVLFLLAAGGLVLVVAAALGLRAVLQRAIVGPISTLAETVGQVRTLADYHHRVPDAGTDEVARLGRRFNDMMVTIQERDEELRRLTLFQQTILDNVAYGIISTAPNGIVTSFNPAAERLLGYTADEVVGKLTPTNWHDPDEMAQRALELYEELGETVAPGFEVFTARPLRNLPEQNEWTFVRKDGTRVPVLLSVTALRDGGGRIIGSVGLSYDLTERKQAQEEVERIGNRNRLILESAGDGIFGLDSEGRVSFINRSAADALGYHKDELIGKNIHELIHMQKENGAPYSREECPVYMTKIDGSFQSITNEVFWRKDGTNFPVEYTGTPIMEKSTPIGVVVTFKDVTERQRVERQLQQAQKMESIGNLAGGIAHDFNNILSAILGFIELSLDKVEKGTQLEDNLQEVYSAGKRAKDLVKQILTFARKSDDEITPIRPGLIAEEVIQFLRSSIPTTIEIKKEIDSNALTMGNATQMHQIFMNLCTNAAQAMEDDGGILEVKIKDIIADRKVKWKRLHLKPGPYIEIVVFDTGSGIEPGNIHKIFDPYFTTKSLREGTGLGLALVHGIVEINGGKITVESTPGEGTTFTLYLPSTKMRDEQTVYESEALSLGSERILFVDDEISIAKMGSRVLGKLGYFVTTETNSVEALELFRSNPGDFDLVISDMTMPHMTGDNLAIELMKIRPDIPVILCTGYSRKISEASSLEMGIKAFAYKPIFPSDLAKTVRKVLDAGRSRA